MKAQFDLVLDSTLSDNKHNFLKHPQPSRLMPASEVDSIAQVYQTKWGITILKNGGSPLGKKCIIKGQTALDQRYADEIQRYQSDNPSRYLNHLKDYGLSNDGAFAKSDLGSDNHEHLQSFFYNYIYANTLNPTLKQNDFDEIERAINADHAIKKIMGDLLDSYVALLTSSRGAIVADYNLTPHEVGQEIAWIQKNLKEDQCVGYVFTNGNTHREAHFEVIIISKTMIIKPVTWHQVEDDRKLIHSKHAVKGIPWAELPLNSPLVLKTDLNASKLPGPQADPSGCGTLGFLYLKELLKEDQNQLQAYTLRFPLEDGSWLFFPSPHVLRYSQSQQYNDLVATMLLDTEEEQSIQYGKQNPSTLKLSTLKGLLQNSIAAANRRGDKETVKHNTEILKQLPDFRKRWEEAYTGMMKKRQLMSDKQNQYLAYSTHRYAKKNDPAAQAFSGWECIPAMQLIIDLEQYCKERKDNADDSQSQYYSFFGHLSGMSANLKISAAKQMIAVLDGTYQNNKNPQGPVFTHDELMALQEGTLGALINKHSDNLPREYHEAIKKNSYDLSRRW